MNNGSIPKRVVVATALTAAFEGLRAGAGTFRALLDLPARREVGPLAFAAFSRATDLSARGVVFYVVFGTGGALFTCVTWFVAIRAAAPRSIRRLLATSAIASLLVLVFTSQAAPLMWRVNSAASDPALLSDLMDRFTTWTLLRVACVDVSFAAVLTALTVAALPLRADP
jgi:hypothetical protein